jgi:hypothetical protein
MSGMPQALLQAKKKKLLTKYKHFNCSPLALKTEAFQFPFSIKIKS